jgi:hypothetical protein
MAMMTPDDFVRNVYYAQTNVLLNFVRTDDKYKEVLTDANMVLQELQMQQDWNWLKERVILGHMGSGRGIPEFELPTRDIYKVATNYHDCVKLYAPAHSVKNGALRPLRSPYPAGSDYYDDLYSRFKTGDSWTSRHDGSPADYGFDYSSHLDETDYITIPWEQVSSSHAKRMRGYDSLGRVNVPNPEMRAFFIGNTVTFNRPPRGSECGRIAVTDALMQIPQFHICDDKCPSVEEKEKCPHAKINPLDSVPDPLYVVMRTAAYRAEMDPTINPTKLATLADRAQKILSAMRENDAAATIPDVIDYSPYGFYEVT